MATERKKNTILITCSGAIIAALIFALNKSEEKGIVKEKTNNNNIELKEYKAETNKKIDELKVDVKDFVKEQRAQNFNINNNFMLMQNKLIELEIKK